MPERVPWALVEPERPPTVWRSEEHTFPGLQGVFFDNVSWQGQSTRVFAWLGMPSVPARSPCPGMILLHGGGGTAYAEWVQLWNQRGYAAIAIDQCGCVPSTPLIQDGAAPVRHAHGGPPGWDASFEAAGKPIPDQWVFHVIAAVSRAHAILASQPGVDPERIGITGISWGGYMTSLTAGVLPELKCAIPVYGCGYLGANSFWNDEVFPSVPRPLIERWEALWDPSHYLASAQMPMCWVSGTNDFAYPLDSLQKSYNSPGGERALCIRVEMPHSHPDGWAPVEIGVFADSQLIGGTPLPHWKRQWVEGQTLWAEFESSRPLVSAEINYTRAAGQWQDRKFNRLPAVLDPMSGRVHAPIPTNTTVCFLNVFDDRGCVASAPHLDMSDKNDRA